MSLVKSKQRVADHGEVFTPAWMVEAMLDLVKGETERIDSRFLEPACGDGNFLVQILRRKLAAVELKYGKSNFERRHYALLALMCLYGIELLTDNIAECRANLLAIFAEYLNLAPSDDLYRAAFYVLSQNLVHGDALTMRAQGDLPITFASSIADNEIEAAGPWLAAHGWTAADHEALRRKLVLGQRRLPDDAARDSQRVDGNTAILVGAQVIGRDGRRILEARRP